jgi:ABC-type Zn uptake system ZnuABC Zn-binding protein ZnuA
MFAKKAPWTPCAAASLAISCLFLLVPRGSAQDTKPRLKVCATVTDLGELAKEVGGDQVDIVVFAKGPQDAHFVEAKPSFIKELSTADLLIHVGLELEIGWAPNLWQNARNGKVLPGTPGFLDASTAITPLDIPQGVVTRALGDVHPYGSPHYLTDPVSGLKVARLIRDRLASLRPEKSAYFKDCYDDFAKRLGAELVGKVLAAKYDAEKLALLAQHGKLDAFLKQQGDPAVGGWLGRMAPFRGTPAVSDHRLWSYFAERFGLQIEGALEPKPGLAPTTKHLAELIDIMKQKGVKLILSVSYFDPRHARFVSEATGAKIAKLAHACGAEPGTEKYLAMIEYNVHAIEQALGGGK